MGHGSVFQLQVMGRALVRVPYEGINFFMDLGHSIGQVQASIVRKVGSYDWDLIPVNKSSIMSGGPDVLTTYFLFTG